MSTRARRQTAIWTVISAIFLAALSWAPPPALAATNRYVSVTGSDANGNSCANPLNPCRTIVYGVSQAAAGDTISVGAGTYTGERTANDEKGIVVGKDVKIAGVGADLTIVEANAAPGVATHRVFTVSNARVELAAMAVRHGKVGDADERGGGILAGGSLTVRNALVADNTAACTNYSTIAVFCQPQGGGISVVGDLRVFDSTITGNSLNCSAVCWTEGGGIYVTSYGFSNARLASIRGSTIANNSANCAGTCGSWGGGVFMDSRTMEIVSSSIHDNHSACSQVAGYQGCGAAAGGMYARGFAPAVGASAGLAVLNSTISGNRASCEGHCPAAGGGLFVDGQFANVNLQMAFVTVSGNTAMEGAGLRLVRAASVTVAAKFRSNLIADNGTRPQCSIVPGVSVDSAGTNYATDATCPGFTTKTSSQLNLGPLALNSPGTTKTHALLAGSQAIDVPGSCPPSDPFNPTTDQRGVARPKGLSCDLGAYERFK